RGREARGASLDVELDAPVRLLTVRRRVVGDRTLGAEALARQPRLVDALAGEPLDDGGGARRAELLVRRSVARIVGVALDADLRDLRVLGEHLEDSLEDVVALLALDLGARRLEPHLVEDLDLARLDERLRAPVPLRIRIRRAGLVGARIDVVQD